MNEAMELKDILKDLYIVSGFRMAVYDTELTELYAYPEQKSNFCSLIQEVPGGLMLCNKYDAVGFQRVKETGEVYIYRCYFGLYEAIAPLYHFGILAGYLIMGQTLDTEITNSLYVTERASGFITDSSALKKAVANIPIRSKEQILSCISIMEICAAYITLANYIKGDFNDLTAKVQAYLHERYASKITLEQLCQTFCCSRSTLTTTFREAFGASINEYLLSIRIKRSMELLKNKSLTINDIALSCGFSDQNYFTKVFRKYTGITPSASRKTLLEISE